LAKPPNCRSGETGEPDRTVSIFNYGNDSSRRSDVDQMLVYPMGEAGSRPDPQASVPRCE
jgi:hypothetical protein